MLQPLQSAFQCIHALHGFPIAPHFRTAFEKNNHRLCVTSLPLGTNEFQYKISKYSDVSQSLIYGINEKRRQKSQKQEYKNAVIDSINKIKP
ncbi:MAG: hypothetical protein WC799_04435 [Desulfobacteraceae bacterium]|jgi:hypothetical protein